MKIKINNLLTFSGSGISQEVKAQINIGFLRIILLFPSEDAIES